MDAVAFIGTIAAICSVVSFLPQAWQIVKTRDTKAISAPMYAITVTGFGFWIAYGLTLGKWPIVASNGICFVTSAFILTMKLLPRRSREKVAETIENAAP